MSLVGPRPWLPSMVAHQVANGFTQSEFVVGWTGNGLGAEGVAELAEYTVLDVADIERC